MTEPYYSDDRVTIYNADIRDGFPGAPGTVSCVVTSPPYNVGIEYDEHDDVMPWDDYVELALAAAKAMHEAMHDGARSWVNVVPVVPIEPLPAGDHSGRGRKARTSLLNLWYDALGCAGIGPWDIISWTRNGGNDTAWGSWQSPAGPNLRGNWESILVGYRGVWARDTPDEWRGWQDQVGGWVELVGNVWKMRPASRTPDGHPVPFPVELPSRCIRLSTWPDETVLDPFMGAGTTLDAAVTLGRKAIGIEISERYCELAARRFDQGRFDFGGAA